VQAQGPYLLGGYCFGGLVALEMAQRLQAQRQAIDLLVMVNASISQIPERHYIPRSSPLRLSNLRRHRDAIVPLRPQAKWGYVWERAVVSFRDAMLNAFDPVKKIIRRIVWETCIRVGVSIPVSLRSPYILEIYQNARRRYSPRSFEGNTILFLTGSRPQDLRLKLFGQTAIAPKIHDVPGDHHTVLEEPNVGVWAKALKAYLDREGYG
jgi:thioesterase domain-containing protein